MKRKKHGMPVSVAMVILAALALIAAVVWLLVHLAVMAGVAVIVGGTFYLGRKYERRRVAAIKARPARPAVSSRATLPQADDWHEPDRERLLADPRSGAHPLGGER